MKLRTSFLALTAVILSSAGVVELRDIVRSTILFASIDTTTTGQINRDDGTASELRASQGVDESALRYFAARGDTKRLEAEISRLRALYPGWQPPEDPLAIANTGDPRIEALWELYSEGRYDEIESAIADRRAEEPGFLPPVELVEGMRLAKARQSLMEASDGKDYQAVVEIAAQAPQLLTCGEVDVMWRLAEAFALTKRPDRAVDAYGYILQNCSDPAERDGTIRKASLVLDVARVEDLLRFERKDADGQPEFQSARDDLARTFVSRAADDGLTDVPEAYVTRLEATARREQQPADAILLGWYSYQQELYSQARVWFRQALDQVEAPEAAQGLALAEIALEDPGSAEAVLYDYRDFDEETLKVYLSAVANLLGLDPPKAIAPDVLARMAPVVIGARDPVAAEQFGWYAHYLDQDQTATQWFRLSLGWDPEHEPAAYGLALALNALGDKSGVADIQRQWAGRSERIAVLNEPARNTAASGTTVTRSTARTSSSGTAARASSQVISCRNAVNFDSLSPDRALSYGWCLMEINRPIEAVRAFERALASGTLKTRQEAAYGQSLAYLRLKMPDRAAVSATAAPLGADRAVELQSAILADRAIDAFRLGRYRETIIALDQRARFAAERQDLMILRGFAYHKLGHRSEARRIF